MKKFLLMMSATLLIAGASFSQTTILDFEAAATSTQFQFFGGNLDGTLGDVIANPNASGINTSANVFEFKKSSDAPEWGGGFTNPDPTTAVDLTTETEVCVDVHMDHIGNVALKFENSATGGNWITSIANTKMNEWERICFDVTVNSIEDPIAPAAGHIYPRVVLFFDFGTAGTGSEAINYVDNITVGELPSSTKQLIAVSDLIDVNPTLVTANALISFNKIDAEDRQVRVFSAVGETVMTQTVGAGAANLELNRGQWAAGLYFVQVQQGKEIQTVRILVY